MYKVGDSVVHPVHGTGKIVEIKELRSLGPVKRYYAIKLLGQRETVVMVPVRDEARAGLRSPIPESRLRRVWRVLRSDPDELPANHDRRCQLLIDKLHAGDILQLAEALRDLAARKLEKGHLTLRGKRLYERGMALLAGEVASAQGSDLADAEAQISRALDQSQQPVYGV
jgi:CarD family transcriptional regulator